MGYGPEEWRRPRTERSFPERPWLFEYNDIGPGGYSVQNTLRTLWIGDVHLADKPPGWRTDTYRDDVLAKVQFLMAHAEFESVDVIIFAGDIFHSKRNVSWELFADFTDLLQLASCEKLLIAGNHDLLNNNLEGGKRRPLGVLDRLPDVTVAFAPLTYARGPLEITAIPYIHDMRYAQCQAPQPTQNRWSLLAVHYGVTPKAMPYHTLVTDEIEWTPGGADVVFSGHVHDDLGVWKDRDGRLCFNTGSISRGSLTEENLNRKPRALVADWSARPLKPCFTAVEIPVRPADEAFNLDAAAERREGEAIATEFLSQLGSAQVVTLTLDEVRSSIRNLEVPERVQALAISAVEEAWDE